MGGGVRASRKSIKAAVFWRKKTAKRVKTVFRSNARPEKGGVLSHTSTEKSQFGDKSICLSSCPEVRSRERSLLFRSRES